MVGPRMLLTMSATKIASGNAEALFHPA
jgi:hypothetical protein